MLSFTQYVQRLLYCIRINLMTKKGLINILTRCLEAIKLYGRHIKNSLMAFLHPSVIKQNITVLIILALIIWWIWPRFNGRRNRRGRFFDSDYYDRYQTHHHYGSKSKDSFQQNEKHQARAWYLGKTQTSYQRKQLKQQLQNNWSQFKAYYNEETYDRTTDWDADFDKCGIQYDKGK